MRTSACLLVRYFLTSKHCNQNKYEESVSIKEYIDNNHLFSQFLNNFVPQEGKKEKGVKQNAPCSWYGTQRGTVNAKYFAPNSRESHFSSESTHLRHLRRTSLTNFGLGSSESRGRQSDQSSHDQRNWKLLKWQENQLASLNQRKYHPDI